MHHKHSLLRGSKIPIDVHNIGHFTHALLYSKQNLIMSYFILAKNLIYRVLV